MTTILYIASFLALLGVLVTIHEFGHFIVARMCRVHVQRFSIGMGPVFYKKYDKYGTEFALSAVPLGGYVSMITNKLIELEPESVKDLTEDQLKNTFDSKPKWQRASIMFAGPLANFLLSICIFAGIVISNGPIATLVDPQEVPVVSSVVNQDSNIRSESVFKLNDKILSINNTPVRSQKDFSLELLTYAGYSGDINFSVLRTDKDNPVNVLFSVDNFLTTKESQKNPVGHLGKYLGIDIGFKNNPIIGAVREGSAADKAEFQPGDIVLQIGSENINFAEDISSIVKQNPNTNLEFKIERNNEILYLPVNISSKDSIGVLGVSFRESRNFIQSLSIGIYETYNLSLKTLQLIGKMITGNMGTENLSGPIGIAQMAGNTAQAGIGPFIYLMGLLSISLAVLNLLPIPVLDGGQLTLLGIEAIRGKPLPERAENIIYTGGAVLVGMLMIFAIFNDIARFF
ncbi:MAG: RIP metalloprotease RseP [Gammaproteobacteria bacterium]